MEYSKGINVDISKCTGCRRCQLVCSERKTGVYDYTSASLTIQEDDYSVSQIKFNDDCDLCYLCVQYCKYGALKRKLSHD